MLPLGHIAGLPVEETALSFSPVVGVAIGAAGVRLRRLRARPTLRGGATSARALPGEERGDGSPATGDWRAAGGAAAGGTR